MNKKKIFYAQLNPKCTMRAADLENQESGKQVVSGYAVLFNNPTVLFEYGGIEYKETIERGAFDGCDMTDVVFDRGHRMEDTLLARNKNGTLTLEVDDIGLKFTADIADTQTGRDTYELIKRGDITGCSFAAEVTEEAYDRDNHMRKIIRFKKLYDVSAVTFPAYAGTEINAEMRSAFGIETPDDKFELMKKQMLMMSK